FAAAWASRLVFRMATVVSDEFRAKHEDYVRRGQHQRYQGLTVWSPNINLFRDPRWGRGQETYGEDPYLTGQLAVPFIRGLQGADPWYLKTIATVKHFAVHSGPEPLRHQFDAVVSERDLRESYLPHFEAGIREAGAYSLMCAYNRVFGAPACGSDLLLKTILRGEWHFPGYVVSDCGAIDDIYQRHRVAPTAAAAAALGVRSGTDLDCGREYANLVEAVHQGLISGQAIVPARVLATARGQRGLDVAFFASRTMTGAPLFQRTDSTLDAHWGEGAPRADMNVDDFGVRWTGTLRPTHTGTYRLALVGTVKFQLYLDDSLVVQSVYPTHDGEFPDPRFAETARRRLEAGRRYRLRVDGEES